MNTWRVKVKNIVSINKRLNTSDCVLIPKNISCTVFNNDRDLYCFKLQYNSNTTYCRFSNMSPDNNLYAPSWVIDELGCGDNEIVIEDIILEKGNMINVLCSHETDDPTTILEHKWRDHKIFYKGKKCMIKMFDDYDLIFEITDTNTGKPVRVTDEISFDIEIKTF